MRITEVFLDLLDPTMVHASVTCDLNVGLVDAAEAALGEPVLELDRLLEAAAALGTVVPVWSTRGMQHCERCTLVATTSWAVAA